MSTFVVSFVGNPSDTFRGRVRHVPTGEERTFASIIDLVGFLEEMNAVARLPDLPDQKDEGRSVEQAPSEHGDSRGSVSGESVPRG